MRARSGFLLNMLAALLLLCCWGTEIRVRGSDLDAVNQAHGVRSSGVGSFTSQGTDSGPHSITTGPTAGIPNHPSLLKSFLLHEALLTKDFRGDQQFFAESDRSPASTHLVPHEDAPAFSDIAATTVTMAATSPMTTTPTAAPYPPILQGRSEVKGKSSAVAKILVTADSLTTPVTHPPSSTALRDKAHGWELVSPTISPVSPALTTPVGTVTNEVTTMNKVMVKSTIQPLQDSDMKNSTASIGTTSITTTTVPCGMNLTAAEGYIKASLSDSAMDCMYSITVYLGYGVEVQVLEVRLPAGEAVTLEDLGAPEPSLLANESILVPGLVVRSWSNQIAIRLRRAGTQQQQPGSFLMRYQAFVLSCPFPQRPAQGDVSVTSLHAGGEAYFYCFTGYQLQGPPTLTCRNATTPYWSGKEPRCVAFCGGMIRNITVGRITSPGFPSNYSNNLTCHWVLEAPEGQRIHVHFEKVALAEDDDRLLIKNGNNIDSPPLYDSYEVEYLPNEGVVSSSRYLFIDFSTDALGTSIGAALRYEAFGKGSCYEPFIKYGNYTSSDVTYAVGTIVEFSCEPGYTLEQGSVTIECVDPSGPQWNETEPACRAVCSGEVTDSAGVILSPNWPEAYDKGQDCIWGIHVEEDKRIMLDVQVLHLGPKDQLTFYDGDDLTANILAQYSGMRPHFRLYTSTADVTLQFQSDPASDIFGYNNGFVVHFFEVPRNDTCPELPEIASGWKSTSHPELVHGTVVTYQCYPGFELRGGAEILMCQWDLTWSGDVPTCERVTWCTDPGTVEHSRRVLSGSRFAVGTTVQYICDKGYSLSGAGLLTCHSRDAAGPKWSERPPKCLPEAYEPCRDPGPPPFSIQSSEKRFYQAGETLRYSCLSGYQLLGDASIRCVPGHPSQWSSPPPACRAFSGDYSSERRLDVSSADASLEWTNITITVLVPVVVILVIVVGLYLWFSKVQGKSLRLSVSTTPPYDNMTESAFDNPIYETGDEDSREYEVCI
ncbi:seizure protein 6-like isoform X3 [Scleropages formosus]|uniref:seizure protein 6-like isoform X3 n=1 Tax=Scleropages formosus TaxID=113540 RepID=UPI0010FA6982|nr:seizure protein 6-like isoform X3 [Scleropages formosus]